ncbi:MAG TPA: restriction endonuclease subunit R, partial [Candidatus Cloacimonadota bacterium]|nr:restriction endonuclease subunit R [Candidatus Cloacimonadota bacterium]
DYHRIFALPERSQLEINFPHVTGYRIEIENDVLRADFSSIEKFIIDNSKYPTETKMGNPFSPEIRLLSLQQLKDKRRQELEYTIAKNYMTHQYRDYKENRKFQYFPQILQIVRLWLDTNVQLVGDAFVNMLFHYDSGKVCQQIHQGIVATQSKNENITPLLNPYQPIGSTQYVNGITTREVYPTKKSHVNYVVADTESWEQLAAKALEEMKEVLCYVKNAFLGFSIPYVKDGKDERQFYPDFIAKIKTPKGREINLIIEITGYNKEDKAIKGWYTKMRWLPAVNSSRKKYPEINVLWDYLEIADDIKDIKNVLRDKITEIDDLSGT